MSWEHSLVGLPWDKLRLLLAEEGLSSVQGRQVWEWIYRHGVHHFSAMTNLSLAVRQRLTARYSLARPPLQEELLSHDGTRKWLFRLSSAPQETIETVLIPEKHHITLCLSSQVGCPLQCRFCRTGTQGFRRNLTPQEIVAQVFFAKDALKDWGSDFTQRRLTHIVLMGMGEPLLNAEAVREALKIFLDPYGGNFSRHKVTVSTVGILPELAPLSSFRVPLTLSLHAPTEALRTSLMPINAQYSLKEIRQVLQTYPVMSQTAKVTVAYILLKDANDSPKEAHALRAFLQDLSVKVNLLSFNPWEGVPFATSSERASRAFAQILRQGGIDCFRRRSRGQDILAACGQLRSEMV
jgi:23S rRNA (adenine2503-C2)-methyltransferase